MNAERVLMKPPPVLTAGIPLVDRDAAQDALERHLFYSSLAGTCGIGFIPLTLSIGFIPLTLSAVALSY